MGRAWSDEGVRKLLGHSGRAQRFQNLGYRMQKKLIEKIVALAIWVVFIPVIYNLAIENVPLGPLLFSAYFGVGVVAIINFLAKLVSQK